MTTSNRPTYHSPSTSSLISKQHFHPSNYESLIADFRCLLQSDSLISGHLYCMQKHFCFYADSLKGETKVIIPVNNVIEIKKCTGLGNANNAIEVHCVNGKVHMFVEFLNRDMAYSSMMNILKAFTSKQDSSSNNQTSEMDVSFCSKGHFEDQNKYKPIENTSAEKSPQLSYRSSERSNSSNPQTPRSGGRYETIKGIFPISPDQAYECFFGRRPVYSIAQHLADTGSHNIRVGKWKVNPEINRPERKICLNKDLRGIIFSAEMVIKAVQEYYKQPDGTIFITTKSKIENAPYSDHYYIKERIILAPMQDSRDKCLVKGFVQVIFLRECGFEEMLRDRIYQDKKREHKMWFNHIQQNKLFENLQENANNSPISNTDTTPIKQHERLTFTPDNDSIVPNPGDISHGNSENGGLPVSPRPSVERELFVEETPSNENNVVKPNLESSTSPIKDVDTERQVDNNVEIINLENLPLNKEFYHKVDGETEDKVLPVTPRPSIDMGTLAEKIALIENEAKKAAEPCFSASKEIEVEESDRNNCFSTLDTLPCNMDSVPEIHNENHSAECPVPQNKEPVDETPFEIKKNGLNEEKLKQEDPETKKGHPVLENINNKEVESNKDELGEEGKKIETENNEFQEKTPQIHKSKKIIYDDASTMESQLVSRSKNQPGLSDSAKDYKNLFDSPAFSQSTGIKSIYNRIRETSISKIIGKRLKYGSGNSRKSQEPRKRGGEEIKGTRKTLNFGEIMPKDRMVESANAKKNRIIKVLVILLVFLFFAFAGTTVYLTKKINALENSCKI